MKEQYVEHPGLPLAPLFWAGWHWWWFERLIWDCYLIKRDRYPFCTKIRGANFVQVWVGPLTFVLRRPWIASRALSQCPELFEGENLTKARFFKARFAKGGLV